MSSDETNAITDFITILAQPFVDLETVFQQMLTERGVFTAVGAQLDIVGKLVGVGRMGLDDTTYRRYIRAQISTNKSTATLNELIAIADLIVFDDDAFYRFAQPGRATLTVDVEDYAMTYDLAKVLILFLRNAIAAGVRLILRFWPTSDEDDLFTFKAYPGDPQKGKGFGAYPDPTTGGVFLGAIE